MLLTILRGEARYRERLRRALAAGDPRAAAEAHREAFRRGLCPPLPTDADGWHSPQGGFDPASLAEQLLLGGVERLALSGEAAPLALAGLAASGAPLVRRLRLRDPAGLAAGELAVLDRLTGLEELELSGDERPDRATLTALARLPRLRRLTLRGLRGFDDGDLAELAVAPSLHALALHGCQGIDGTGLRHLARGVGERLEGLTLAGCPRLDDVHLVRAYAALERLRDVGIESDHLEGHALAVLRGRPRLRSLRLDLPRTSPLALADRLPDWPELERLELVWPAGTGALLAPLRACPALQVLALEAPLDAAAVPVLLGLEWPALRELILNARRLGDEALVSLSRLRAPALRSLRIRGEPSSLLGDMCPCGMTACDFEFQRVVPRERAWVRLRAALPDCDVRRERGERL